MNHAEPASARPAFAPGAIIAGKYRVERMLAEGGMGLVVAATHMHLDQSVALKFLRGDVSSEWDALARFTRESKAAAQLRSEHVAHVLDAGITEDGTPYMVMEYLEGHSLARALQTGGPLDVATAVEYVIQACEGLAEAHARGIVHRDVKPYNLFVVERSPGWNTIKILDFGISKFAFSDAPNVVTGVIIGSPCYMSPEQLRSTASVDHRTDIWSLGATLYELLAGHSAFDASQTLAELVTAILERDAPDLHDLRADVPPELAAIVSRCLSKSREDRFASTGEVAMALLPFAPARARVLADRAASMRPVFRCAEQESEIASGMPVPTWNGFSMPHREASATLGADESGASPMPPPQELAPQEHRTLELTSEAPSSLDVTLVEEPTGGETLAAIARSRTFRWLGVATLALAGVLVFVTILVSAPDSASKATAKAIPAPPPPSVAVPTLTRPDVPAAVETLSPLPGPAPSGPESSELSVRATPASAKISIDGAPVGENPFHGSYPKDGAKHHIAVSAGGYDAKSQDVTLGKDTVVEIGLTPHVSARPSAASASTARAAKRPATSPATTPAALPQASLASTTGEVDSAGGRAPLRPIETRDPYGNP